MMWVQAHFAKTQQVVKQSVAWGFPKTSERQRIGACTEFGNIGGLGCVWLICDDVLALTHLAQEPVSLEHHSTWKGLQTEDHETHQAD